MVSNDTGDTSTRHVSYEWLCNVTARFLLRNLNRRAIWGELCVTCATSCVTDPTKDNSAAYAIVFVYVQILKWILANENIHK